jgi:hypothetical protein
MKYATGFFRFWYDFLVGVVGALIVCALLLRQQPELAQPVGPALALVVAGLLCGSVWMGWRQHKAA